MTLFDPSTVEPKLSKIDRDNHRCNAVGRIEDWTLTTHLRISQVPRPRCNRRANHRGPHRVWTADAEVRAEWT